jgi:hypothetical protein
MSTDIAVITCVFNPVGYKQPRENFDRFTEKLEKDGVPWYAIELAFFDRPYSLPASRNIFQYRSNSILWHKENLLNVLAGRLPPEIRKVIWADCDLIFSTPDWWKRASEMLEDKVVIQPFETALWHKPDGVAVYRTKRSFVQYLLTEAPQTAKQVDRPQSHPGFAWGARREFFEKGGLYPYNIIGGGDLSMALTFAGLKADCDWNEKVSRCLDAYAAGTTWINRRLGYLPGVTVSHMWHGDLKDRQLDKRRMVLKKHDYDPLVDISKDANGMWQWATNKPKLHQAVCNYFQGRKEDQSQWSKFWSSGLGSKVFFRKASKPMDGGAGGLVPGVRSNAGEESR